mmetsp:Transcript_41648/g.107782  ORF Transcript_41648/g.107782 Transcript_41648/m.107782 type:complete len:271 (+) Transcript_41648:140-952(+)
MDTFVHGSHLDEVHRFLRGVLTVAIAAFGTVFSGMIASVDFSGTGAYVGCSIGFAVFLLLGGLATGFWNDVLGAFTNKTVDHIPVPHVVASAFGKHGRVDVIMTIHEARNVQVQQLPWQQVNLFCEVTCGKNPVKRTCVKTDGKFMETFKLQIRQSDENIAIKLKNQDVFGDSSVGFVVLPIQKDILDAGFPRSVPYELQANHGDRLERKTLERAVLVVSFDPSQERLAENSHIDIKTSMASQHYGSVAFLPDLEFNPNVRMQNQHSDEG